MGLKFCTILYKFLAFARNLYTPLAIAQEIKKDEIIGSV
jgi:hypothetical protein